MVFKYKLLLPSPETVSKNINFKKAFWIIALSILVMQIYSIIMWFTYEIDLDTLPLSYQIKESITGLLWYLLMTGLILYDIDSKSIPFNSLFKIDFSVIKRYYKKVLKYFFGCGSAVLAMKILFPSEPDTVLNSGSSILLFLSFLTTVVFAPICEEIAFRGYLYNAMIPKFKRIKERLVVNAMLFAAVHIFLLEFLVGADVPYYIFIIGYLLAKLYEESRSILPSIALHALNNGFVLLIELLQYNDLFINLYE